MFIVERLKKEIFGRTISSHIKERESYTEYVSKLPDEPNLRKEAMSIVRKASEIIDSNDLNHALGLYGVEKSALHCFITLRLLNYKMYELVKKINPTFHGTIITDVDLLSIGVNKTKAFSQKPGTELLISGFRGLETDLLLQASENADSLYRVRTTGMAVNDMFVRLSQEGNLDAPFSKSTKISPEVLGGWIAHWQPRIWERAPAV